MENIYKFLCRAIRNPTSYTGVPRFDSRPQGQSFVTSFVIILYDFFQENFAIIPQNLSQTLSFILSSSQFTVHLFDCSIKMCS